MLEKRSDWEAEDPDAPPRTAAAEAPRSAARAVTSARSPPSCLGNFELVLGTGPWGREATIAKWLFSEGH